MMPDGTIVLHDGGVFMLYADDNVINKLNVEWSALLSIIKSAVQIKNTGDYCQPLKPYLRYNDYKNRIIAMPAYLGGDVCIAGIKWIASFPDNLKASIPRAHCTIILNDALSGIPLAFFNSARLSVLRTVAVSGAILEAFLACRGGKLKVGIIGFGPVGKGHYQLINEHFIDRIEEIGMYDIRGIAETDDIFLCRKIPTKIQNSWEYLYSISDVVITCTVASTPYIDVKPRDNALLLNISLRDYNSQIYSWVKNSIIVDDWDEVCRENTDIENMNKDFGLLKKDTLDMYDVLFKSALTNISKSPIMFNPMGLAIFDIAISKYYYQRLLCTGCGVSL